ncbi:MAG: NepR family anti-sigma factor [Pseudomonadota bacterium]
METMASPKASKDKGKGRGASSASHKALITRNLRLAYEEVTGEPVPDRILLLLRELYERDNGADR